MAQINSRTVFSNLIWRFLESCGAQLITFIVSIILARLLDPVVYGTIAIVTVFITILQVFVNSGLGTSVVQKKDADQKDFSTVFYFNILMCLVIYVGLFFLAPVIANFYGEEILTPVIRVLGIVLIISGVSNIQQAYVTRNMLFKKFFFSTLGGTIGSAVVGIVLAYMGYGVWALVGQTLTNQFLRMLVLWVTVRWRPSLQFSFKRLKVLFSFGWKLLVSALIDTVYTDARQLIIGKKYSTEDLGFYNRGNQFPSLIAGLINSSIDSVLLPSMSSAQDNKEKVKAMTRRAIKTSSYVVAPLMLGLAACAEPMVSLLLTDKWLFCVPYLRIFCITYLLYPIQTANLNAIKAMGRSDLFLVLEIIKKLFGVAIIVGSMWISVEAMAWGTLAGSLISSIINAFPNKKLLNYSWFEQIKDILPNILLALFMGVGVFFMGYIPLPNWALFPIQVIAGILFYWLISVMFNVETYHYILSILKSLMKRKKSKPVAVTQGEQNVEQPVNEEQASEQVEQDQVIEDKKEKSKTTKKTQK